MTVLKGHKTSFLPQILVNDCLHRQVTSACTVHYIKNSVLIEPHDLSNSPPLYIAAVGTAWSPLGWPTNGHATVYLGKVIQMNQLDATMIALLHLVGSSVLLYLIDDARSNKNQVYGIPVPKTFTLLSIHS